MRRSLIVALALVVWGAMALPAASEDLRGTGDLGLIVERASGSVLVIETTGHSGPEFLKRRQYCLDGFTIARIWNTLTPTQVATRFNFDDDHISLALGPPGDGERRCQRIDLAAQTHVHGDFPYAGRASTRRPAP